jgi:hypothetical protein
MRSNVYLVTLRTIYPDFCLYIGTCEEASDEILLHECLEYYGTDPSVAFSAGKESESISPRSSRWQRAYAHDCNRDDAEQEKYTQGYSEAGQLPSCSLANPRQLPEGDLELVHGHLLVGPMTVESVSRCKYGFVLVGDYSRALKIVFILSCTTTNVARSD